MVLWFLSFSLDNEKERALDSVGVLNMANCGGLHNISLNHKKKKKKKKSNKESRKTTVVGDLSQVFVIVSSPC
jgi:hypothetical protein